MISNSVFALPDKPSQLRKEAVSQGNLLPELISDLTKTTSPAERLNHLFEQARKGEITLKELKAKAEIEVGVKWLKDPVKINNALYLAYEIEGRKVFCAILSNGTIKSLASLEEFEHTLGLLTKPMLREAPAELNAEEEKEARKFLSEKIDIEKLESGFADIIKLYGYASFKKLYVSDGENAYYLFVYVLPAVKNLFTEEEFKTYWPDLVKLGVSAGENAGYLFKYGLLAVKNLITDRESLNQIGQDLVKLGVSAGENAYYLFVYVLPAVKNLFTEEEFKTYWPDLVKLGVSAGENAGYLFEDGLPAVKNLFTEEEFKTYWPGISSKLKSICQSANDYNRQRLLEILINKYLPIIKENSSLDLFKVLDFYNEVIIKEHRLCLQILEGILDGIKSGVVSGNFPKKEKEQIFSFVDLTHTFSPALFKLYKQEDKEALQPILTFVQRVLSDNVGPKELANLRSFLVSKGIKDEEIQEALVSSIQFAIPSSGASFVKKEDIQGLFKKFEQTGDRRENIPANLRNKNFGDDSVIELVEYKLKEGQQYDPEGRIKDIVSQLRYKDSELSDIDKQKKKSEDETTLKQTLSIWFKDYTSQEKKQAALKSFYAWASHIDALKEKIDAISSDYQGVSLLEHLFLDKDNLFYLLKEFLKETPSLELPESEEAKGKEITNPSALLKQIQGIWSSKLEKEAKETKLTSILSGLSAENLETKIISFIQDTDLIEVIRKATEVKGKLTITQLIEELFKEPLSFIQKEKNKFSVQKKGEVTLEFRVVKGIPYGLWGLNAGVCIATDLELWKSDNFMLLVIIDKNNNQACGFVHLFKQTVNGWEVLTLPGIEPSVEFLSHVKADQVYPLIEKALIEAAKEGSFSALYIPTEANILSNRSDIAKIINKKYASSKRRLDNEINWNNLPKPYPFKEVYVVWERGVLENKAKLLSTLFTQAREGTITLDELKTKAEEIGVKWLQKPVKIVNALYLAYEIEGKEVFCAILFDGAIKSFASFEELNAEIKVITGHKPMRREAGEEGEYAEARDKIKGKAESLRQSLEESLGTKAGYSSRLGLVIREYTGVLKEILGSPHYRKILTSEGGRQYIDTLEKCLIFMAKGDYTDGLRFSVNICAETLKGISNDSETAHLITASTVRAVEEMLSYLLKQNYSHQWAYSVGVCTDIFQNVAGNDAISHLLFGHIGIIEDTILRLSQKPRNRKVIYALNSCMDTLRKITLNNKTAGFVSQPQLLAVNMAVVYLINPDEPAADSAEPVTKRTDPTYLKGVAFGLGCAMDVFKNSLKNTELSGQVTGLHLNTLERAVEYLVQQTPSAEIRYALGAYSEITRKIYQEEKLNHLITPYTLTALELTGNWIKDNFPNSKGQVNFCENSYNFCKNILVKRLKQLAEQVRKGESPLEELEKIGREEIGVKWLRPPVKIIDALYLAYKIGKAQTVCKIISSGQLINISLAQFDQETGQVRMGVALREAGPEQKLASLIHNPPFGIINDPDFIDSMEKVYTDSVSYAVPYPSNKLTYKMLSEPVRKTLSEIEFERMLRLHKTIIIFNGRAIEKIKSYDENKKAKFVEMLLFHENVHNIIQELDEKIQDKLIDYLYSEIEYAVEVELALHNIIPSLELLSVEFIANRYTFKNYPQMAREDEKGLAQEMERLANDPRGKEFWLYVDGLEIYKQAKDRTRRMLEDIERKEESPRLTDRLKELLDYPPSNNINQQIKSCLSEWYDLVVYPEAAQLEGHKKIVLLSEVVGYLIKEEDYSDSAVMAVDYCTRIIGRLIKYGQINSETTELAELTLNKIITYLTGKKGNCSKVIAQALSGSVYALGDLIEHKDTSQETLKKAMADIRRIMNYLTPEEKQPNDILAEPINSGAYLIDRIAKNEKIYPLITKEDTALLSRAFRFLTKSNQIYSYKIASALNTCARATGRIAKKPIICKFITSSEVRALGEVINYLMGQKVYLSEMCRALASCADTLGFIARNSKIYNLITAYELMIILTAMDSLTDQIHSVDVDVALRSCAVALGNFIEEPKLRRLIISYTSTISDTLTYLTSSPIIKAQKPTWEALIECLDILREVEKVEIEDQNIPEAETEAFLEKLRTDFIKEVDSGYQQTLIVSNIAKMPRKDKKISLDTKLVILKNMLGNEKPNLLIPAILYCIFGQGTKWNITYDNIFNGPQKFGWNHLATSASVKERVDTILSFTESLPNEDRQALLSFFRGITGPGPALPSPPLTRGGRTVKEITLALTERGMGHIPDEIKEVLKKGATQKDFEDYLGNLQEAINMVSLGPAADVLRKKFQEKAISIFMEVSKDSKLRQKLSKLLNSALNNEHVADLAKAILNTLEPESQLSEPTTVVTRSYFGDVWKKRHMETIYGEKGPPEELTSFIVESLKQFSPPKVVDLGTGNGLFAAMIKEQTAIPVMVGVDSADINSEIISKNINFIKADVENTGLAEDSFDGATATYVFDYLPDKTKAIRELHRILRPNGQAVIVLHHPQSVIIKDFPEIIEFNKALIEYRQFLKEFVAGRYNDADLTGREIKLFALYALHKTVKDFQLYLEQLNAYAIAKRRHVSENKDKEVAGAVLKVFCQEMDEEIQTEQEQNDIYQSILNEPNRLFPNIDQVRQFFEDNGFRVVSLAGGDGIIRYTKSSEILGWGVVVEKSPPPAADLPLSEVLETNPAKPSLNEQVGLDFGNVMAVLQEATAASKEKSAIFDIFVGYKSISSFFHTLPFEAGVTHSRLKGYQYAIHGTWSLGPKHRFIKLDVPEADSAYVALKGIDVKSDAWQSIYPQVVYNDFILIARFLTQEGGIDMDTPVEFRLFELDPKPPFDIIKTSVKTLGDLANLQLIEVELPIAEPPLADLSLVEAVQIFNYTLPKYAKSELKDITVTEDTSGITYVVNLPEHYSEAILLLAGLRSKAKSERIIVQIRTDDDNIISAYNKILNETLNLGVEVEKIGKIREDAISSVLTKIKVPGNTKYLFVSEQNNPDADRQILEASSLSSNLTVALVKKTEGTLTTATAQILEGYFKGKKTIVVMPELITDKGWSEDLRSALLALEKV